MLKSSLPIQVPLLNPNEPEALLVAVHVAEGQRVSKGEPLCTLETTKSTADLAAEESGYVAGIRFERGQTVRAGEIFCYLAPSPEWSAPDMQPVQTTGKASPQPAEIPQGLRITQPALAIARQYQLDLADLPAGELVTESVIRALIQKKDVQKEHIPPHGSFDPTAVIVYGGGGHGKSLIELLRALGIYHIAGVVDDGLVAGGEILGVPILGGVETLSGLHNQGVHLAVNAVGGIGNISVRVKVFQRLAEAGFACPAVVHPTAYVEPSAKLSAGVQVFPQAYIGSEAQVGYGSIVNSGAIVSHDCTLGAYTNISPGAMLAGEVKTGEEVLVGMGVTVNLQVTIGSGARIGNGATVKQDVPQHGVVRAGSIWPG